MTNHSFFSPSPKGVSRAKIHRPRIKFRGIKKVKYPSLRSTQNSGCRGRSPLPEREVSSLTLSSPSGPQARQKQQEWISVSVLDIHQILCDYMITRVVYTTYQLYHLSLLLLLPYWRKGSKSPTGHSLQVWYSW